MKQLGAIAELERAIEACKKVDLAVWEVTMQFQNSISHWANSEGFEVKVTVVKK